MKRLDDVRVRALLEQFGSKRIGVIGDLMLDKYYWGSISRISPEAPVPVVEVTEETTHLGGAANVAHNIRTLGARPVVLGVVGDDAAGKELRALYHDMGFDDVGICVDAHRPTTVKTRVIAHNQHVVRVDHEARTDVSLETQGLLLGALQNCIRELDVLILEDYNKGVLVQPFLQHVIALAREHQVPVMVDPKFRNFFEYRGVTLFKPNRKEMEDALGAKFSTDEEIDEAVASLCARLVCPNVLLTLGARGMLLWSDGAAMRIPTVARNVADVSGAGDTVIATMAVSVASGATMREAAVLANVAAGIVCEAVGIVPIQHDVLLRVMIDSHLGART